MVARVTKGADPDAARKVYLGVRVEHRTAMFAHHGLVGQHLQQLLAQKQVLSGDAGAIKRVRTGMSGSNLFGVYRAAKGTTDLVASTREWGQMFQDKRSASVCSIRSNSSDMIATAPRAERAGWRGYQHHR